MLHIWYKCVIIHNYIHGPYKIQLHKEYPTKNITLVTFIHSHSFIHSTFTHLTQLHSWTIQNTTTHRTSHLLHWISHVLHTCTANPTWGDIFESSKLKARTSLLPRFSEKRRSSFELWALKQHSKMSPQVGSAVTKNITLVTQLLQVRYSMCGRILYGSWM